MTTSKRGGDEVEWTRGPWEVTAAHNVVAGNGAVVAHVSTGHEEWIANARLIAAAPEMFEALEKLLRCFEEPVSPGEQLAAQANAMDALDLARGGEAVTLTKEERARPRPFAEGRAALRQAAIEKARETGCPVAEAVPGLLDDVEAAEAEVERLRAEETVTLDELDQAMGPGISPNRDGSVDDGGHARLVAISQLVRERDEARALLRECRDYVEVVVIGRADIDRLRRRADLLARIDAHLGEEVKP